MVIGFNNLNSISLASSSLIVDSISKAHSLVDSGINKYTFVPKKTEDYFVEFTTPTSASEDSRGCVAVVLSSRGY